MALNWQTLDPTKRYDVASWKAASIDPSKAMAVGPMAKIEDYLRTKGFAGDAVSTQKMANPFAPQQVSDDEARAAGVFVDRDARDGGGGSGGYWRFPDGSIKERDPYWNQTPSSDSGMDQSQYWEQNSAELDVHNTTDALQQFLEKNGYSIRTAYANGGDTLIQELMDKSGRTLSRDISHDSASSGFGNLVLGGILAAATGGLGAAFGGGLLGNAAAGALTGGLSSSVTGADPLKSALSGAMGAGLGGANLAGAAGVTDKLTSGLINGAIKSGAGAAINGGDIGQGLLSGAITGGVTGGNLAAQLGIDGKALQAIINKGASGLLTGKDPRQVLQNALIGAGTSAGKGLLSSALADFGGGGSSADMGLIPGFFDGTDSEPKVQAMDDEDLFGPAPTYDDSGPDQGWWDHYFNDGDAPSWGGGLEGTLGDQEGDYSMPTNDQPSNWWDSLPSLGAGSGGLIDKIGGLLGIGGGKGGSIIGTGSGGGTSFDLGGLLGGLFGGVTGKDVLGMAGAGVSAAMLERQAEKNREFQKELQDRAWAREDKQNEERRARMAPSQRPGLLRAAMTTFQTGDPRNA